MTQPSPHSSAPSDSAPGPSRALQTGIQGNGAAKGSSTTRQTFGAYRSELDLHHDKNERLVRFSRDVTADSKKLIFHLHRYNPTLDQPDSGSVNGKAPAAAVVHPSNLEIIREGREKAQAINQLILKIANDEHLGPHLTATIEGTELEAGTPVSHAPLDSDRYERAFGQGLEEYVSS